MLERADRILAAFTAEQARLTGGRIAALAGLPAATAHRPARDMVRQGLQDALVLLVRAGGEYERPFFWPGSSIGDCVGRPRGGHTPPEGT